MTDLTELLAELRAILEAATKGSLGHFRHRPGEKKHTKRSYRLSKVARKHAAQHALGHKHGAPTHGHDPHTDVHATHGGPGKTHHHIAHPKTAKTGTAYGGKQVPIRGLRRGAKRHMAARGKLAKQKWAARKAKIAQVKKKLGKKKVGKIKAKYRTRKRQATAAARAKAPKLKTTKRKTTGWKKKAA